MTQKQPQAGEWWESQNRLLRVFVIGIAPDEVPVVCEQDLDPYRAPGLGTNWQHLPDCTGWDWQPEVWPQWYLPSSTASSAVYHRRESKTKTVGVRLFEMVANLRDQMDAMIKRANSSPKRVPMRLWIADDGDTSWGFEVAACAEKPERTHQPHEWRELFFDGNGFFVEGQQ